MMMEMFLDEQKAKENNIDIEECYLKVDRFFKRRGVKKLDKGIYFGKKKYYPSKSYKNAWKDIKKFLLCSNFIHRQYSGYVSKTGISMADVGNILDEMSIKYHWFKKAVRQFDVTIVSDEYSFISRIKQESKVTSNKDELV